MLRRPGREWSEHHRKHALAIASATHRLGEGFQIMPTMLPDILAGISSTSTTTCCFADI
eukprot:m.1272838 g.1272838  ORF g.1272838 m.1272838 type:complete len:59 (-) comp24751_c0_seq42:3080-3256(-)